MHRGNSDESKRLSERKSSGRSATRERGGVGLGVGVSIIHLLCKVDPAGLPAGGDRGRGRQGQGRIIALLSDSDFSKARANTMLARALRSGLPGIFFMERSGVKKI